MHDMIFFWGGVGVGGFVGVFVWLTGAFLVNNRSMPCFFVRSLKVGCVVVFFCA